jgi:hypothetical protein
MIRRAEPSDWEAYRARWSLLPRLWICGDGSSAHHGSRSGHHRDRTRVSAEQLMRRPISQHAPGVVTNRRSSVSALMVSVCLQPR